MEFSFERWLEDAFRTRARLPAGAVVTYALVRGEERAAEMLTCRCEFHDDSQSPRKSRDYGRFFFGEEWLETAAAVEMINQLRNGTALMAGTLTSVTTFGNPSFDERRALPKKSITRWPEWLLWFRESSRQGPSLRGLHDPLVGNGLPPFNRAIVGAHDWVWTGLEAGNQYDNHLVVVVPDTRARMSEVTWERTELLVKIQARLPPEKIEVQCRLETVAGSDALPSQSPVDGLVKWEIPPTATRAELYLIDDSSGLIAAGDFTNFGGTTTTDPESLSPQELADIDIPSGESDLVEFKPFWNDKNKSHEIAETVIAFANSKGGRLYVGVDDHGAPQGKGALADAVAKNSRPEDWFQALEERFSEVVRNLIKPVPRTTTSWVLVGGEPVLVISVNPGTDRPYSTHDNYIYVRKGASCRAPEPQTELKQMFDHGGDEPVLGVLGLRWPKKL